MIYNFINTDNILDSILEMNDITLEELNKEFDFSVDDEVFLNFKEELLNYKDKKFLIVGDYDCDGICATTIIKRLFNYLNITSNHYIPSRIKEGYGLNLNIIEKAKNNNFDCLIMVDNGIVAIEALNKAQEYGLKVFIIDHHEYEELPKNATIIHSNIVSDKFSKLSAGGLSYILSSLFYEDELSLILGGLTTISDMMPVVGFNRTLIKKMMEKVNKCVPIRMLNDDKDITYDDLSFNVIPKINCVSRMEPQGNPNYLVKYFNDLDFARQFIETINYLNKARKDLTKQMGQSVYKDVQNSESIILSINDDYKEGLCGLVANRILHEFNKAVIILAKNDDGTLKGSGRAPEGVNLFEILKPFNLFETYGGHESAVGLSISLENEKEFRKYLSNIHFENHTSKDVIRLEESLLNNETFNIIEDLKPFGTGFKEPLLAFDNNDYKKIIVAYKYPKYLIRPDLSAISFNESFKYSNPNTLIGTLRQDSYRKGNLSFLIEDLI